MRSRKEELKKKNLAFKESLEEQLETLKSNFSSAGKNALWIGGGLIGAYGLIKLLNNKPTRKGKKKKKPEGQKIHVTHEESVISSEIKKQVIVFLLGLALERLTRFLKELDGKEK